MASIAPLLVLILVASATTAASAVISASDIFIQALVVHKVLSNDMAKLSKLPNASSWSNVQGPHTVVPLS